MDIEKQFLFVTSAIAISLTICHLISSFRILYDPDFITNPYCIHDPTQEFMSSTTRATGIGYFNNIIWKSSIVYATFFRWKLANHKFETLEIFKSSENLNKIRFFFRLEISALFCTTVLYKIPDEGKVLTAIYIFHIFSAGSWMFTSLCFSYLVAGQFTWMWRYSILHVVLMLLHCVAWSFNAGKCVDYVFSFTFLMQYSLILCNIRYHYLIFTSKNESDKQRLNQLPTADMV